MDCHTMLIWGSQLSDSEHIKNPAVVETHDCAITPTHRILGVQESKQETDSSSRLADQVIIASPVWSKNLRSAMGTLGIKDYEKPGWHLLLEWW